MSWDNEVTNDQWPVIKHVFWVFYTAFKKYGETIAIMYEYMNRTPEKLFANWAQSESSIHLPIWKWSGESINLGC